MSEDTTTEKSSGTTAKQNTKNNGSKKNLIILIAVLIAIGGGIYLMKSGKVTKPMPSKLSMVKGDVDASDASQFSYAVGYALGKQMEQGVLQVSATEELNNEIVAQAVADILTGGELALTEEQVQEVFTKRDEMNIAKAEEQAGPNIEAGTAFREDYKTQEGVEEGENGVLIKSLAEGSGEAVGENVALVNYVGKHIDGSEFDASEEGQPVPMVASQVVPGFGSALTNMKTGDKWEIVIPQDQAYGSAGAPGVIEPGETLIFEVEIVEIKSLEELQQAQTQAAPQQ